MPSASVASSFSVSFPPIAYLFGWPQFFPRDWCFETIFYGGRYVFRVDDEFAVCYGYYPIVPWCAGAIDAWYGRQFGARCRA